MHLFKNFETGGFKSSIKTPACLDFPFKYIIRLALDSLTAEEKPGRILLEFGVLVLLIHTWLLADLLSPKEPATQAKPLLMQVSLISVPAAKSKPATTALPKPSVPEPVKQKPVVSKKPKFKHKPKTVRQVKAIPEAKPDPAPVSAPAPEPSQSKPTSQASAPKPEPFTEANFRANYGFNPKPIYPRIARSHGWQGRVLLRVQVSAAGTSDQVSVHKSSGHEILDTSAIEAVQKWRFIPARRGDTPVASSVLVPILFTLQD